MSLGLYIHIPFCLKKCNYCSFYSKCGDKEAQDRYISIMCKSIENWSKKLCAPTVDTVYFGGGTPSILETDGLAKILESVSNHFPLSGECEITTEINPTTHNSLDFHKLKSEGFNRISMGMQSAIPDELKALGRIHTNDDVLFTVDKINAAGIDNYSVDVMLGIPMQTTESLVQTLDFTLKLNPSHISTYILKIEENTPFYYNKEKYIFPDEDIQADFYMLTSDYLIKAGFRHYEISNFCKNSKVSHHNMKYWKLDDYLGLGPSAHSLIGNKRFYFDNNLNDFKQDITSFESIGKTPEEYIMLSLRTDEGFKISKYKELFGTSAPADMVAEAKVLEKLGLMESSEEGFKLTEKGYLLSNTVIARLLSRGI